MTAKKFPGNYTSLENICEFITREAKVAGLNIDSVYAVQLAVDEACSNIIEHAYSGENNGEIVCECNALDDGLEVILKDKGKPFDPETVPEPEIGVPLEELKSRGAGLFLIRKLMDEVDYKYYEGTGAVLKMIKKKSG
jgi:anti-sigma regulatory factor (Ser/Thr protein kinase)